MKKQLLILVLAFSTIVFISAGCSKNSNSVTVKSNTELLTSGSWKFSIATASGTDVTNQLQACQKDNIVSFSVNGNGNVSEGATKCNAGDPDNIPFTWNFMQNETQLHISTILFSGGSSDFTVEKLTESELVISQYITRPAGPSILVSVKFIH